MSVASAGCSESISEVEAGVKVDGGYGSLFIVEVSRLSSIIGSDSIKMWTGNPRRVTAGIIASV